MSVEQGARQEFTMLPADSICQRLLCLVGTRAQHREFGNFTYRDSPSRGRGSVVVGVASSPPPPLVVE